MKFEIPTKDIAERIGVCTSRVRQRARELEEAGVARKLAGNWLFAEQAVEVWRSWKEHISGPGWPGNGSTDIGTRREG